ncbi:hypothetical protein GTV32_15460 [Gordonia sp. SID5947]|uniref:hypothetical protein n=1 Tax=Gordonia sp. SID5947 TaxID=2690315 RepID=UPI0013689F10|nr:hypothetical protein [Gordonia sp. SID5947]MYR07616.1 hypothetical protein [Gordonia sp. SID5947]
MLSRPAASTGCPPRITAATVGIAGVAAAVGIGLAGAGAAHAGTMPVTHPGEPSVAMTITNHTDKVEHLVGSGTSGNGVWVNGPRQTLGPGASETVTAVAPHGTKLAVNVAYRIGTSGPTATYEILNSQSNTNIGTSGISGPGASKYWLGHTFGSHYPATNVVFDQW